MAAVELEAPRSCFVAFLLLAALGSFALSRNMVWEENNTFGALAVEGLQPRARCSVFGFKLKNTQASPHMGHAAFASISSPFLCCARSRYYVGRAALLAPLRRISRRRRPLELRFTIERGISSHGLVAPRPLVAKLSAAFFSERGCRWMPRRAPQFADRVACACATSKLPWPTTRNHVSMGLVQIIRLKSVVLRRAVRCSTACCAFPCLGGHALQHDVFWWSEDVCAAGATCGRRL